MGATATNSLGQITLREWLIDASAALLRAGVSDAHVAAECLLMAALGYDRAQLFARLGATLPPELLPQLDGWLQRCLAREPLAYVLGEREFWSRTFVVSPAVLVPRPETEHLVEVALACFPEAARGATIRACDVGTGSGCLAATLAAEWPAAEVVATDVSAEALAVARENARRLGVAERVHFMLADGLGAFLPQSFDLVISNPPYLSETDWAHAEPELAYEPRVALDGGPDGLAVIRRIVAAAPRVLRRGGWLVLEMGSSQGDAVQELARQARAQHLFVQNDLAGWPRVVAARW
jgi:release factor glutamine methyltransferase